MNEKIRILVFVIILGTLSSALLVGVDVYTRPMIAKNEELKLKSAILDVLSLSYNKDTVFNIFTDNVEIVNKSGTIFYVAKDKSIVFPYHGPGLWGPISGIVAINPDGKTIKNLKILHQEETPGLGSRISEQPYLSQYLGKDYTQGLKVDVITGATLSSRAFEKLILANLQNQLTRYLSK